MPNKQNRKLNLPDPMDGKPARSPYAADATLASWTPAQQTKQQAEATPVSEAAASKNGQKAASGVQAPRAVAGSQRSAANGPTAKKNGSKAKNTKGDAKKGTNLKDSKTAKIAVAAIVGALAVVYIAGVVAFSLVTYPNTSIAGIDVSLMNAGAASSKIESAWSSYKLTVSGDGFEWNYQPDSSKPFVNGEKAASERISAQEPFAWPVKLMQNVSSVGQSASTEKIDLSQKVDTSMLSSAFNKDEFESQLGEAVDKFNEGRTGTFAASTAYDSEQGKFTLAAAKTAEKLNKENVIKFAEIELAALESTADLTQIGSDAYTPLNDSLTDEQVETACNAANDLLGVNVTLKLNGNDAGKLDSSTFKDWITFDDSLNPTLSDDSLTDWANQLADNYNTVGSERTYTRADGKQITVSGGDYGWSVDVDSLVSTIKDAVSNKQSGDIELSYGTKGDTYTNKGERDWGAYIDVDISEQYARYYDADGNILWESGVITGNPTQDHSTPTGVYYIKSNSGGATLVGKIDPSTGEPEYKTPVTYWMPFVGNAVGFHDASWQASYNFGSPTAYQSVGSHGCVNLPPAKAKELHELISTGLCVVVHN